MSKGLVVVAFGIGIVVLAAAMIFPALVGAPSSVLSDTISLDDGESHDFGEFSVTLESADGPNQEMDVTVSTSSDSQTEVIPSNGSATYEFGEGDVSVTPVSIQEETARMTVESESMFGWSDEAILIGENLGLILVLIAFVMIVGLVVVVMS